MKTQTIYGEMPYPECKPEHNTEVICKFENDKFGTLFYWNDEEGFDAMTEPHHLMVVAWLKPEVVEEGNVDLDKIWNDLMLPILPVVDLAEMGLMPEVKNMCMIAMEEAVRQDRANRIALPEEYLIELYEKNCEEIGIGNNGEMCFVFTLEQLNQLHLEIREKLNNIQ